MSTLPTSGAVLVDLDGLRRNEHGGAERLRSERGYLESLTHGPSHAGAFFYNASVHCLRLSIGPAMNRSGVVSQPADTFMGF
jgi:hypothetical protein